MRWQILIKDTKDGRTVVDMLCGRLVASAVATCLGDKQAANHIIGDPRGDS
jgi:hypothetical protein